MHSQHFPTLSDIFQKLQLEVEGSNITFYKQTHHTKLLVSHLHILAIGSKAKDTDEHKKRQGYDVANDDDLNVAEFVFLCQRISGGDIDVWMPRGKFEPKEMQLQG